MINNEILIEILRYWETIEFLNQSDYPYISKQHRYYDNSTAKNILCEIDEIISAEKILNQHSKNEGAEISETVEICLGKIPRDECVKDIYALSGRKDNRIEKTKGSIAIVGLQITSLHHYVANSLNISPIIWILYKLKSHECKDIVGLINEKEYQKDLIEFEHKLKHKDIISTQDLKECFVDICKKFLITSEFKGFISYQCFKNKKAKEKYEYVQGYSNLHTSFYYKDLKMVEELIKSNSPIQATEYLKSFIGYAYERKDIDKNKRINILSDSVETRQILRTTLHIKNAPLGKWPSKFSPSFMQQLAINLSIQKDNLSVNGPPGTGKTTLLKEIIADSIVKKAKVMATYTKSDDAFSKRYFKHGPLVHNGYHKWETFNSYYILPDEINRYSIIVASSNNTAVENITKELPDGEALCKGLKSEDIFTDNGKALKEIYNLFNEQEDDIFFTDIANMLFNDELFHWGLISAPLGNRKNQNEFIEVLNTLFFKYLSKTESILEHRQKYQNAIINFYTQLDLVEGLKNDLKVFCNLESFLTKFFQKKDEEIKNYEKEISKANTEIDNIKAKVETIRKHINKLENDKDEMNKKLVEEKQQQVEMQQGINIFEEQYGNIIKEISELENNRSFKDIILRIFHIETIKEGIIKGKYIDCKNVKVSIEELKQQYSNQINLINNIQTKIIAIDGEIEENSKIFKKYKAKINDKKLEFLKIKEHYEYTVQEKTKAKEEYHEIVNAIFKDKNDYDSYDGLFVKFFNQFFSSDSTISGNAHLQNPWCSEHFNREREKLFYYALQVIKEFALSSFSIRTNIKNLLMMWTHNEGNEIINYDDRDRYVAYPYLFQSLLSFVPVVSTTFASVERFFEDYHQFFSLGTLIIDEAGQAQPYMALGLLARCRKTIVVGDPKQVEPIIKDDLDAIKQLIKTDVRSHYMNKHLSIQEFSDGLNPYGMYYDDLYKTWVGCPLVVHRRCISPMFEISNELSYNNMMKQCTELPNICDDVFAIPFSQWVDVSGKENNVLKRNHYIKEQGAYALEIIIKAFEKSNGKVPSIYVISPFTSVIDGLKNEIISSNYYKENKNENFEKWISSNCGTVHTFQGKEANEVVFLLGCDRDALPAIKWVNTNIINVAVTRAKYRICIIGEYDAWKHNKQMQKVKGIMDAFAIKIIEDINKVPVKEDDSLLIKQIVQTIPKINSFVNEKSGETEVITKEFMKGLELTRLNTTISEQEMQLYNLNNSDITELSKEVREHLIAAIKIDRIIKDFEKTYHLNFEDRSMTNILFCKAFENHLKDCFVEGIKKQFGNDKQKGKKVNELGIEEFMIGMIHHIINKHIEECIKICKQSNHDMIWWQNFCDDLNLTREKRNECCHPSLFTKDDEKEFRYLLFERRVFVNSNVGKELEK